MLPVFLRQECLEQITHLSTSHTLYYYTDGSVDVRSAVKAVFVCANQTHALKLITGTSIFQAEVLAIHQSLQHAGVTHETTIIIQFDSLFYLKTLTRQIPVSLLIAPPSIKRYTHTYHGE